MTKQLWKLDKLAERMWVLATMASHHAAALGMDGRGMAIVSEEARSVAERLHHKVAGALFDGEALQPEDFLVLSKQLRYLALNTGIEACALGERGKQATVCAEYIRAMARNVEAVFADAPDTPYITQRAPATPPPWPQAPWPAQPLTTNNGGYSFLQFSIGGVVITESLDNIREVFWGHPVENGAVTVRGTQIPVIDAYPLLPAGRKESGYGIASGTVPLPSNVLLRTPYTTPDKLYAVLVDFDSCHELYLALGTPIPAGDIPAALGPHAPLSPYVRECWHNENGEPFIFLDWGKLPQPH